MFTIISVYLLMVALIFWSYSGYILLLTLLWMLNASCRQPKPDVSGVKIALLIPCYNEEGMAERKVANCKALKYNDDDMIVCFIDGSSTDKTVEIIRRAIAEKPCWKCVESDKTGKINQLNVGLSMLPDDVDIVVCTDMDAILEDSSLQHIIKAFNDDPNLALAGANISPISCLPVEKNYWEGQNTLRILESTVCTSSIVIAPFYAFRKRLVKQFPKDCVADDIYIAFEANTRGYRTAYIADARGQELRAPDNIGDFFQHKFRKGNAFLRELYRFLYRMPEMKGWWLLIYLTKFLQLALTPWVLPYFALCTLSMLLSGGAQLHIACVCLLFLGVTFVMASCTTNYFKKKNFNGEKQVGTGLLLPFVLSNLILILVGVTYPFYRQDSNYGRFTQVQSPTCEGENQP